MLGTEQSGDRYFHLLDLSKDYDTLSEAQDTLNKIVDKGDFDRTLLMDVFAYLYSPWSGG